MDNITALQQLMKNIKETENSTADTLLLDFSRICRICLSECSELCDLYQSVTFEDQQDVQEELKLKDIIDTFINEKIEQNDNLPQHLCLQCSELAWKLYSFKQMCILGDETLRLYVSTFGLPEQEVIEYVEFKIEEVNKADASFEKIAELNVNETLPIESNREEDLIENQSIEPVDGLNDKTSEIDELHSCSNCNEQFDKKSVLNRHRKKLHHFDKPFDCTQCGQTFAQAQTLTRHTKIHQSDQRNKICSFCGKCFIRSDDLKRHIRIHTGERPFACAQCPKRYKQTSELKEHEQSHSAEKLYMCSTCGKALATRNGLYVHMKKHRGEKNHVCKACGKRFVTSGELTSHVKHIHSANNVRQFKCTVAACGRAFVTKVALNTHIASRHSSKDGINRLHLRLGVKSKHSTGNT